MYIDNKEEFTGVETVGAEAKATFRFDASSATATMLADGDFAVYAIDGAMLVNIPAVKAGETIDLSAVTEKVIIIKSGNFTIKTVRK